MENVFILAENTINELFELRNNRIKVYLDVFRPRMIVKRPRDV